MSNVAGIDVGKARLDVPAWTCRWLGYAPAFRQHRGRIAALLEWLGGQEDILRVVYEPTGGYELPLAQALGTLGMATQRVHSNRVRAYAQTCGPLANTDRPDAQVLSRYGAAFERPEHPQREDEPAGAELQDLLRRRERLVRQRVQERNRLDQGRFPQGAASIRRHVAWLDGEIAQREAKYQALLSSSATLSQQAALYRSVPGIGPLTAATLAATECRGPAEYALGGRIHPGSLKNP